MSEQAIFGTVCKEPNGTAHLVTLNRFDHMVCGKRRTDEWIAIPSTWEQRCPECFGAIQ